MSADALYAVLLRRESDATLSPEGWAVYSEIRRQFPTAYVDLAQIGFCRPVPDDDPDHHRLKADALAAMWRTYRAAGVRVLVVSGRVDDDRDIERYAQALAGTPLTTFHTPPSGDLAHIAQDVRERLSQVVTD